MPEISQVVTKRLTLRLPYPPSVNRYWRMVKGRMIISAAGREYRSRVESLFRVDGGEIRQPYFGPIGLDIEVRPPDNRRRDLDNVLKAMLDSLAAAGFYADDSQVCSIRITRGPSYTPDGFCVVRIAHLDAEVH